MYDARVRSTVALYLTGAITEEEAVQRADISRAELRNYARTSGTMVAAPGVDPDAEADASTATDPDAETDADAGTGPDDGSNTEPA